MSDGVRVTAVAVTAVTQIVGSPLGSAIAGRSVGAVSDDYPNLVTPAGYAFTIWGLIFAGCLAWAVYEALPAQRTREIHRRVGWPLAAAFAGNTVWEVIYPLGGAWQIAANVLIFAITAAAAVAFVRMQSLEVDGLDRFLPRATAALLLGWVTVAPVANVGSTGVYLGAPSTGTSAQVWAVVALVAVAVIGVRVVLWAKVAAGPFAAAVVWGIVAVAANGYPQPVTVAAAVAAAAIAVAVVIRAVRVPVGVGRLLLG